MKFCWSTLHVRNMEESLKFYKEIVGLEIDSRFAAGPGVEIVFLGMEKRKSNSYLEMFLERPLLEKIYHGDFR